MGENPRDTNAVRGSDRVTIAQAASLLDVHPNTVRNRVKAGVYDAEKVVTENGQTWMITRNRIGPRHPPEAYGTSPQEAEESLHPRSWWRRFFGFE